MSATPFLFGLLLFGLQVLTAFSNLKFPQFSNLKFPQFSNLKFPQVKMLNAGRQSRTQGGKGRRQIRRQIKRRQQADEQK